MMKSCNKIKTVVIIQPLKIIKKKSFCKNINRIPKHTLKEINNLSTLSEKLSLSYQESELITPPTLKKNVKIQFQFKDNSEWRTAALISRSGKATGKYSKEWNSKFKDCSIHPTDFEWNVDNLHIMSHISANTLPNTKEMQYSEIYSTAIENQANIVL